MTNRSSLDRDYFEAIYAATPDPWSFKTSPYEREKYAATLAVLSRETYASGLEIGCSIGVLTRGLAGRCGRLLSVDTSSIALAEARRANADLDHVAFRLATVPRDFPDGRYDLIVLSEVLYYLNEADLADVAQRCVAALAPNGDVILCHWLGETDYPLGGDQAADLFITSTAERLSSEVRHRSADYRLDRLTKRSRTPSAD